MDTMYRRRVEARERRMTTADEPDDDVAAALRRHREAYRELERLHEGLDGDDYPPGILKATSRVQDAWWAYLDARRRRWGI
jgi:hypothetical protein